VAAAAHVVPVVWPPFMTEALSVGTSVFGGILNGTTTVPQAFKTYQKDLVNYAKAQGFTVSQ
jgi:multiple sugar transport system substrate-binding protein